MRSGEGLKLAKVPRTEIQYLHFVYIQTISQTEILKPFDQKCGHIMTLNFVVSADIFFM